MPILLVLTACLSVNPPGPLVAAFRRLAFEAPKFGLKVAIPKDWPIAEREKGDRVFVAVIRQEDEENLALPPASWGSRRRTSTSTAPGSTPPPAAATVPSAKLAKNEIVKAPKGDRLETIWEFRPGRWRALARAERSPDREPADVHVYLERG